MPELISSRDASLTDLRREADEGRLYAILDACDEPRVPARVQALGPTRAASLYRGDAEQDLAAIAPYLVRVDPDTLDWIAGTLWSDPWGIFAVSEAGMDAVRTHFRKFLLVDAPDGDQWYFRFYDPRVLARFLPTCDAAQLTDFFGPVKSFGWTHPIHYGVVLTRQAWFEAPAAKPRITFRRA
jgi:uncharacterized protein DUF4123